jgi:yecA family protein
MEYRELTRRLTVSELNPTAAEAHGILCAMVCAGQPRAEELWVDELLKGVDDNDLLAQECRQSLRQLAECTRDEIGGAEFEFAPMLPDESTSLAERAVALYDWARGFLYGLGLNGLNENELSDQGREILGDISSITRLDLDDLEDSPDNEDALMELTEFLRVAVMLVYEEQARGGEPIG